MNFRKGKPRLRDLGLYGVETCRRQRHRYQTPRNLLIYRSLFGNYVRVTDLFFLLFFFAFSSATSFLSRVTVRRVRGACAAKHRFASIRRCHFRSP